MDLLSPKTINSSVKYIKFNEIKDKIFLDVLAKSDARWDGKQEYYFMWPNEQRVLEQKSPNYPSLRIKKHNTADLQFNSRRKF